MNEPLSVWTLIGEATVLVQLVMLLLAIASLVSWVMIFQRVVVFNRARRELLAFEDEFWSGGDLGQLYRDGSARAEQEAIYGVESIFRAGFKEFSRLSQQKNSTAVMEGAQRAMRVALMREQEKLSSTNVLGYMEGTDLKDELIVITAHYDHIGVIDGEVYNGADDDGSGTVCALEIAEAFMKAKAAGKGPRRSVLIMPVTGEEKGLLGSEYYSENPVWPLESTVANLNIDMVGRTDADHKDPNYIYLIGSDKLSTQLHSISETANEQHTKLMLDYKFNDPKDPNRYYFRSDHYNFAKHKIPVIFYFSGIHEDYHKPTDTVDKIMFDKTAVVAKLVFHTAWELANRDERPVVDVENDFED